MLHVKHPDSRHIKNISEAAFKIKLNIERKRRKGVIENWRGSCEDNVWDLEQSFRETSKMKEWKIIRRTLLTGNTFGHDVGHLAAGGKNPHAHVINNKHLRMRKTRFRLLNMTNTRFNICLSALLPSTLHLSSQSSGLRWWFLLKKCNKSEKIGKALMQIHFLLLTATFITTRRAKRVRKCCRDDLQEVEVTMSQGTLSGKERMGHDDF